MRNPAYMNLTVTLITLYHIKVCITELFLTALKEITKFTLKILRGSVTYLPVHFSLNLR